MTINEEKRIYSGAKILFFALIALVGVAGFAALAYYVGTAGKLSWDDSIRFSFYDLRSPGLTTLMEGITYLGEWYSITVICLLALIFKSTRLRIGIPVTAAAILTQVIMKIIKHIIERPRPDKSFHLIEQGGFSFPSGHSITSLAVYGMLFLLVLWYFRGGIKKGLLLVITAILAFAIGLSRIYLGVHFPSDVLAGWCLGAAIASIILIVALLADKKKAITNSGRK